MDLTGYAPGDWWDPRSYDWAVFAQGVGRRAGELAVGATEESVNLITAGQYKAGKKFVQELAWQQAQGASVVDALQQAGAEAAVEWVDNASYGGFRKGVATYQVTRDVGVSVRRGVVETVSNTGNQVLPVDEYAVLSDPQASLEDQIVAGASGMVKCTALAAAAAPGASRISAAVKPSGITTLFNEGGFVAGPKSSPRPVVVQEAPATTQISPIQSWGQPGGYIGPERQLTAGGATTWTREQVARFRGTGRERGNAFNEFLAQSHRGIRESMVETQLGKRFQDVGKVATGTATEMAVEGKNYLRFRTVGSEKIGTQVSLSKQIQVQIYKDVLWIRSGRQHGIHRIVQWEFAGAGPSPDLARALQRWGLPYVH